MKPNEVWEGALRLLENRTTPFSHEAWLQPLGVDSKSEGLRLRCPSEFHQGRVRERFLEEISSAAAQVAGIPVCVELVVDASVSSEAHAEPKGPRHVVTPPSKRNQPARPAPAPLVKKATNRQTELSYSFNTFITGECNALAREASYAFATGSQLGVSPLYISAGSGLGKTHLARSVTAQARQVATPHGDRPTNGIIYTSAESFTTEFLQAMRNRRLDGFKQRYRKNCDLLVVEDVQFFSGKASTQMEIFHTIEHLRDAGVRMMFTSDRLPRDISNLDSRLCSHMSAGLVAEIEPPDASVRREILRGRAASGGVHLPTDCVELLVSSIRGSVRDLEGVLIQLVSSAALLKRPIDAELTENALRKITPSPENEAMLDLDTVIDVVAKFFKTSPAGLASRSRRREVLVPRQLAMYLCHKYTDSSYKQIGRAFKKNHPSVSNAIKVVERQILERAPVRYQVEAISMRVEQIRSKRSGEISR